MMLRRRGDSQLDGAGHGRRILQRAEVTELRMVLEPAVGQAVGHLRCERGRPGEAIRATLTRNRALELAKSIKEKAKIER